MSVPNPLKKLGSTSMPLYAFGSIVVFVGSIVVLDVTGHGSDNPTFIALIVSTIPSLVAALFSERSSRDIRNGVVEDKARAGTKQALKDHGVLSADGPVVATSLEALTQLLTASHPESRERLSTALHDMNENGETT